MLSTRASLRLCSGQTTQVSRAALLQFSVHTPRTPYLHQPQAVTSPRHFSSTPASRLKDFFPEKETEHIRTTNPTWPHPGYTEQDMLSVVPGHRKPETWGDWTAWKLTRIARYCMNKATGLRAEQEVDKKHPTTAVVASQPMTESQWVCTSRSPAYEATKQHAAHIPSLYA